MKIYLLTHFTEIDKTDFSSSLDINGLKEADNIVERLGKLSIDKIILKLKDQNVKIIDISTDDGDLEDVFLRLTKN